MSHRELYRALEKIRPENGAKEEIWGRLSAEMDEMSPHEAKASGPEKPLRKRKAPRFVWAAAAAAVCALLLPSIGFADNVRDFFQGFLTREEALSDYVEEGIYSDTDGHVKMDVVEMLSDEMVVYMTIKYTALDQEGKDWLKRIEKRPMLPDNEDLISSFPNIIVDLTTDYMGNTEQYGFSSGAGVQEMEQFRTEDSRVYCIYIEADQSSPALAKCQLRYWMSDGVREADLDTSANVPVYEYRLKAKNGEQISEYYEPTYIRLSRLSFTVRGKEKKDIWSLSVWPYDVDDIEAEMAETISGLYLISKDGKRAWVNCDYGYASLNKNTIRKGNGSYNFTVVSGTSQNLINRTFFNGYGNLQLEEPEDIRGIMLTKDHRKSVEYECEKIAP